LSEDSHPRNSLKHFKTGERKRNVYDRNECLKMSSVGQEMEAKKEKVVEKKVLREIRIKNEKEALK
jgi:hypothetical protein